MQNQSNLVEGKCSICEYTIIGIEHDGYLWPSWMLKENSIKYPPHGPRLYNFERQECWKCAMKAGEEWHR